ncbi:hypothetical protein GS519_02970 [Leptospira interrogans]|uniref:Uncharacterized protein n=13 Tax=Leptospira interrogans TaxID=173 RepID=Q72UT2_LEPIC|nr:hypothetical protein LIC_10575 [Leptospira interrogans serovar Copenhageni str. Fiocruz L1-130]KWV22963.1 hypothetical protein LA733_2926 [Leptospira interrogans]MTY93852.1 hypothetical protein [Leptospira interrogans serovar Copenhageni]QOI33328.1 hypothetical protein LeptoLang_03190 [Leptospira interrogans serovar Icterohaemorrhagiae]QOI49576.1 hypothetical protein Lepto1489_03225 [Leptospira interrogans serovar Bataviae]
MERAFDMLPNLEPLRMFEVLKKNENFGGKHEETFYYIVLSRLVFKLYFEFIVNLILYVVVPTKP